MRSDAAATADVAVVGGGFSGVMTAVHLVRRGLSVRLFEPGAEPGRGIAYATRDPVHLLNVPAGKMSAFADQPDHFRSALGLGEGTFARRLDYGAYVAAILADHPAVSAERQAVTALVRDEDGWRLTLADGSLARASAAVLALGNEPPSVPESWDGLPVIANPWSAEARAAIDGLAGEAGEVLLIGTGLTMIDLLLSLEHVGFAGKVVAVSRRGLLPRAHGPADPAPVRLDKLPVGNVLALSRWLRRRSASVGFRAAIDSLRPHSAALWQGWSEAERRRFLRHARPWWDVYRHRIAPEIAAQLDSLLRQGKLEVLAGRLQAHDGGEVQLATRDGPRRLTPRLIVNCTGPNGNVTRTRNPLLRQLLGEGLVAPDPLALGLLTDAEDRAAPRLWALGPLTKGMYWEMTAVPDIRAQAERVAMAITKEHFPHG